MCYLKCDNCGHLNEVKTEYLTFCSNCNKKLQNNFRDWSIRHPGKDLEDFKKLVCISEAAIQQPVIKKASGPKKVKFWIGFVIVFALAYAAGHYGFKTFEGFLSSEKTSKDVLGKDWTKNTYGNFGLTVETPGKMTKGDLPVPDNIRKLIDQMDTYNYNSAKGFKVMINSIKYNVSAGQANLQGAAHGSVNEMKMQEGVTDFNYTENQITRNKIPGFLQKGTYKQNGKEIEFFNMGFTKGLILWQVLVAYQADDNIGRIAAKRVIDSVEINDIKI